MIKRPNQQDTQVAKPDPMLLLTKLLIKIDQREKVIEKLQKGEVNVEDDQRSSDSASQSE